MIMFWKNKISRIERRLRKKYPGWDHMDKLIKDQLRQEERWHSMYITEAVIKSKISWFFELLNEYFSFK